MYARVLVALDGSTLAEQAIAQAERVLAPGGLIALARVVEPALALEYAARRDPQLFADDLRRGLERPRAEAASYLDAARRKVTRADVTIVTRVLEGNLVDRLLEAAGEFDLVVLSTRGRSGLARLLHGSVAGQLVQRASVPVLVVRGSEADGDP